MPKLPITTRCGFCKRKVDMIAKPDPDKCPHCGAVLLLLGPKTRETVAKRLVARVALQPEKILGSERDPDDVTYVVARVPESKKWRLMTAWHPGEILTAIEVTQATGRRKGTLYQMLAHGRFEGAYMDGPTWNVPRASMDEYWYRAPTYTLSRAARSVRRNATLAKIAKKRSTERV